MPIRQYLNGTAGNT